MEFSNIAARAPGESFDAVMLVKAAEKRNASNGSQYLDITLMDSTGEMNGKGWNWQDNLVPEAGAVVRVKAGVTEFNGKSQLRIDKIRPAEPVEIHWADLVPTAPEDGESMYAKLAATANSFQNEDLRTLCQYLLEEKHAQWVLWPAALSYHHSERGGLLHHTLSMLRTAEAILPLYPFLDRELLLAGVMLHDMAKMEELNASEHGIATEYSKPGVLLGHITLGVVHVASVASDLGVSEEISLLLQHMLLSHHDSPEFGSPRPPMFPEAEVLHHLDILDARMFDMAHALDTVPTGAFSDRIRSLDGRRLYKHPTVTPIPEENQASE